MTRIAIGIPCELFSETTLTRSADQECRACGAPFIPIMAPTASRTICRHCGGVLIVAVGEV